MTNVAEFARIQPARTVVGFPRIQPTRTVAGFARIQPARLLGAQSLELVLGSLSFCKLSYD